MRGEDERPPLEMAVQMISTTSHKSIKIQNFKIENGYDENLLHNFHCKKLL